MTFSRRDMCLLVTALAASPGVATEKEVLPSKAFPYDELPVRKTGENESRPVLAGELHNGCYLEIHQTRLAPGGIPTRLTTTCTRRCSWSGREHSK